MGKMEFTLYVLIGWKNDCEKKHEMQWNENGQTKNTEESKFNNTAMHTQQQQQ